jgi:ABC-type bacteriocin/lantibiotic exporter with double-glycine peptidase domain
MLELLFAARQPSHGHLSLDGLDSRNWHLESLRGQVQLLRRDEFVDGSIVDNLRLGRPDIAMEEVRKALEKVGMLDELLSRPEGLNLRLRVGGSPLSTSQRISLLIARAFVQQPRLLLIDELLDGLDDNTLQRLTQLVLGGHLPWTVVVATRMPEVLAHCNRKIKLTKSPARNLPREIAEDLASA